jgi:hypothetical protein
VENLHGTDQLKGYNLASDGMFSTGPYLEKIIGGRGRRPLPGGECEAETTSINFYKVNGKLKEVH